MEPQKMEASPRFFYTAIAILLTGFFLQLFLWSRQWVGSDQIALLKAGLEFADNCRLVPFAKRMSAGGRIPGAFLQILVGLPIKIWRDFRSPALFIGISHLFAVTILIVVLTKTIGIKYTVFFLAVYWLSPWRLYHSGFLWEPGFVFLPAAIHLASLYCLRNRKQVLASAILVATIVLTMQIHASFIVLFISTIFLIWKKKCHWM